MRRAILKLIHDPTICIRPPTAHYNTHDLFFNKQIIKHTLQILHEHSPYGATMHFILTYFSELIQCTQANLIRIHTRLIEDTVGASLNHEYLLSLIHITRYL